jgi:cytoskeleton protein RodZ
MSEEQQEVVIQSPGQILKSARETAHLSKQDIAKKLHLKSELIEDLEQDNYDINISITFIKGYLKLYAKQVDVPEPVILAAFDSLNTQQKEPAKLQSFSRRFSHQANDDKLMLVTYLVIAVVIALAVVFWFQQDGKEGGFTAPLFSSDKATPSDSAPAPSAPIAQPRTSTATADATLDQAQQGGANGSTSQAPVDVQNELAAGEVIVSETDAESSIESVIAAEAEDVASSVDQTSTTLAASSDELSDVDSELTTSLNTDNQVPLTAEAKPDLAEPVELIFEFADNCWMNLADATGENIAYGVKVKGRVMPVTGIPPFVVTLGAPEVVNITYAGSPVDMSFIVPGRSAKFELPLAQ